MSQPKSNQSRAQSKATDTVLEVGARLESGPSKQLVETAFAKELEAQNDLFQAMGLADLAHTLVMMEAAIIPAPTARELLRSLLTLHTRPPDFDLSAARGDLYTNREFWLSARGDASNWLGVGRARREATTTAYVLALRIALLALADALILAGRALVAKAEAFRTALMPDYTYLQSAQPTSFAHYLLAFVYPMLRDLERLQALFLRLNRCPAGCGSTNGSRLPQNRERLCTLLGFDGPINHARDAMWQADLPIELAGLLTAALVNLDRLAEDLQIFSTEAFALIELDDRHARASKIMPHKKNPFALTHVRSTANTMIGTLAASAALGRTPTGQPDNRLALYGSLPRAIDDTCGAAALMGEVVQLLRFNTDQAEARLQHSFAVATELADVLVLHNGLSARQAHRLVGQLVRQHAAYGNFSQLTPDGLAATAEQVLGRRIEIEPAVLNDALDPAAAVAARIETGGAAPEAVDAMIAECDAALLSDKAWSSEQRQRIDAAEQALLRHAAGEAQSDTRSSNGDRT